MSPDNPADRVQFSTDLLWKLYLLVLGWLMGLQGTEEVYVDWPVAEGSLTPRYIEIQRTCAHECQPSRATFTEPSSRSRVKCWLLPCGCCVLVSRGGTLSG